MRHLNFAGVRLVIAVVVAGAHVSGAQRSSAQEIFWGNMQGLCNGAYTGRLIEAPAGDTTFVDKRLVMHVRECAPDTIRIPFQVGDDRSRTWVVTRTPSGLRLKHDHRHQDGSEDKITQYGGDTAAAGTAERQDFPADKETVTLIPEARTNVWTMELASRKTFAYALQREGTARRFRIEFDLTQRVPAPPPPWGSR